jgi:hypothetical protein
LQLNLNLTETVIPQFVIERAIPGVGREAGHETPRAVIAALGQ